MKASSEAGRRDSNLLRLASSSALVGLSTVATLVAGLLRAKLSALWLGPEGVGLVSQAQNAALFFATLGSMGVGPAVLSAIARVRSESRPEEVGRVLHSALLLLAAPAALLVLGALLFPQRIGAVLFQGGPHSTFALWVAVLGGVLTSLHPLPGALLYGYERVASYVLSTLVSTLVGALLLVALVASLGVTGALVHVAVAPLLALGLLLVAVRSGRAPGWELLRWRPSRAWVREILGYAGYTTVNGGTYYGVQLLSRSFVVQRFGLSANGVLQAAVAIGSYTRQLLSGGLTSTLFASAARADLTPTGLSELLEDALRLLLVTGLLAVSGLVLYGDLAVQTLYSKAFGLAATLLPTYLAGELVRLLGMAVLLMLLARKAFAYTTLATVVSESLFLGLLWWLPARSLGDFATIWTGCGVLGFVALLVVARRATGMRLPWKGVAITLLLPPLWLTGLGLLRPYVLLRPVALLLGAALAWRLGLHAQERDGLRARARSLLARIRLQRG